MSRNLAETRQVSQLEFEYWVHIEHFPNHQEVPMTWFSEAMGILNHWRIGMSCEEQIATRPNSPRPDVISSADSTAPYDHHDLNAIINSVHHLEGL